MVTFPAFPAGGPWAAPESLDELGRELTERLSGTAAAGIVAGCLTNSWTTAMSWAATEPGARPEVFVRTGDIPAMWLRDSTAQMRPYLACAVEDPAVADVLAAVSRRQSRYVLVDPYANAFNETANSAHGERHDRPAPGPWVWERKYELDSLSAPLQLAYALWRATGRTDHLLESTFRQAAWTIVRLWRTEQFHEGSPYTFVRPRGPFRGDSLGRRGRGDAVARTGLTWSGFRPSDDRCAHGYPTPANALASASLHGLAELAVTVLTDAELAEESLALAAEIDAGLLAHAVVDHEGSDVLAYEVDGLGGTLLGDDANLPSLLSLPLSGWCSASDPLYQATRALVLSDANPWYWTGRQASGIGSPHTPKRHVWPLAIATAGLTGGAQEAVAALETLARTTAGTGLMHESFHVNDPGRFTRPWFGWANAAFSELALEVAGGGVRHLFPAHPRTRSADGDAGTAGDAD
ncbi:metal-independent alpha-mannosidase [Streptacidiphilus pinicola]|uniref:Metal-independent alpha-mannosidase n=1 Tax=Streptacidiphilus pinicola TaxID=2219663 RepID=A0A2X0I863_9ACTN|nr:glycoside hydrolase family 125 protein [Streptacidiphilus pinicola]RAG81084.1 metal-independent alpha-mannosidase [Streptacidiphilus pinicola]